MTSFARVSSHVRPLCAAAGVGLAGGLATMWWQGILPGDWNTPANSGAVWVLVAFSVAAAIAAPTRTAAVAGGLVLVGEVVGYYAIAAPLRDIPTVHSEQELWTVAALWIGPLAGLGGHFARVGTAWQRAVAVLAACGMVGGEGWYLISAGVPAGQVELAAAGAGALLTLAVLRLRPLASAGVLALGCAMAWCVFTTYLRLRP